MKEQEVKALVKRARVNLQRKLRTKTPVSKDKPPPIAYKGRKGIQAYPLKPGQAARYLKQKGESESRK